MNKILSWLKFNEAISGTLDIIPRGPGSPDEHIDYMDAKTLIYIESEDKYYTQDDYITLYNDYLKIGGKPLNGFNEENLKVILAKLNEHIN